MKLTTAHRKGIVSLIAILYIFLFVYAATSKLMDFQQFKVQLGQSPLLVSLGHIIAFVVPTIELAIAGLLYHKKFRLIGLYASFILMAMFTSYIVLILKFSPFVPCSCGGILENMGWTEHLIFNVVFVLLALIAILLQPKNEQKKGMNHQNTTRHIHGRTASKLSIGFTLGILSVIILYAMSDELTQHHNAFDRLFPPHPITKTSSVDLGFNSFYLAGNQNKEVFLGNLTAPLYLKMVNLSHMDTSHVVLKLDREDKFRFRPNTKIQVLPPYFFMMDGTSPRIWRGRIGQWHGTRLKYDSVHFNEGTPIAPQSIVFRALAKKTKQNELGILNSNKPNVKIAYGILEKQLDGVFDTDGILDFNHERNQILYLYHYRNQYTILDTDLKPLRKGKTIDTNSLAKIKVDTLSNNRVTISAPPFMVNKRSCASGNLFFVHSALMSKNEDMSDFNRSDVIDVYNLEKNSYSFSFYIPRFKGFPIRDMKIIGDMLVTLHGTHLVSYRLEPIIFEQFFKTKIYKDLLQ